MTAKEEVKKELERRLASREDTKKEIEVNAYFLESLFRRLKNGEDVVNLIKDYISQKEMLYQDLCHETYLVATLNTVQVLGVEDAYQEAIQEVDDWMKPESCFPNLNQDNKE